MPNLASYLCPSREDLAVRIAAERRRLGLSQSQAASILGITQQSYSQLERSRGFPTIPTLFAPIEGLGMDPRGLLPEWFAAADRPIAMEG